MRRGWVLGAALLAGVACRAAEHSDTRAPLEAVRPRAQLSPEALLARTLELQLLHDERLEAQEPSQPLLRRRRTRGAPEARITTIDHEHRVVIVHTRSRFGTPEELERYLIRKMDKKPRLFHPTRALVRVTPPVRVRVRERERGSAPATRAHARRAIERARPDLRRCFVAHAAADPRVIVKAPAGLVLEQAYLHGISGLRFVARVSEGSRTATIEGATLEGEALTAEDRACLGRAFDSALGGGIATADLQTEVVVWVQPEDSPDPSHRARNLSHQAATLGWLFRERNDHERALEAFRDAAWAYRLPEFQVLIGLQEEELGRPRHALKAYRTYIAERPDAPDVPDIRRRIARLERRIAGRSPT